MLSIPPDASLSRCRPPFFHGPRRNTKQRTIASLVCLICFHIQDAVLSCLCVIRWLKWMIAYDYHLWSYVNSPENSLVHCRCELFTEFSNSYEPSAIVFLSHSFSLGTTVCYPLLPLSKRNWANPSVRSFIKKLHWDIRCMFFFFEVRPEDFGEKVLTESAFFLCQSDATVLEALGKSVKFSETQNYSSEFPSPFCVQHNSQTADSARAIKKFINLNFA